jgi:hypothetical protein
MQRMDQTGSGALRRACLALSILALVAGCQSSSEEDMQSSAPTVDLNAAASSIVTGGSTMLSWSSSNATTCSAAGGWSGTKATSGSQSTGALTANTTFTLSCSGDGGTASDSVVVAVTQPAPAVTLSANPTTVASGGSTQLTWSSTNATSCTASGGWSGAKATSGNQTINNLTLNTTFILTCQGGGGSAQQNVTVNVMGAPPTPTVTLSANPTTVNAGQSSMLTWSSTNATTCTASGGWSGTKATSGTQSTGALNATATFTLACTGTGGTAQRSVTVTVNAGQPAPTVSLSANPTTISAGGQSVLTWNSSNATGCAASGAWSGSKALNGNETVGPATTSTYTLTCTGAGGSAAQSATVTVNGGNVALQGQVDSSYVDIFGDNRVYVFSGNVTPDDVDGDAVDPVLTLAVTQDANACTFHYAGGTLSAGTYTIAFTQDAAADVPGQSNTLVFVGTRQVTIGSGAVTADFRPGNIVTVGPGRQFANLRAANQGNLPDGSVIEVDAGIYDTDGMIWGQDNIVIRGVGGGRAHLRGAGFLNNGKAIIVTQGANMRIENIEFSNARVNDENGAGIRVENPGLTVCNCSFHDNEDGMLGGGGTLVVEYSEFNHNGLTDLGRNHNIYVDTGDRFIFRYNYSHHVEIGHLVKTRARENHILYNRLMDEGTGSSSYNIDVPDGGLTFIIGNLMQQGPSTDNSMMVSYGTESLGSGRTHELYLVNNTLVNDAGFGGFVQAAGGTVLIRTINNLFVGTGSQPSGGNVQATTNLLTNAPGLVNEAGFDYHLTATSPARNAGTAPGSARGVDLNPVFQYKHVATREARTTEGTIDIGAHEFAP